MNRVSRRLFYRPCLYPLPWLLLIILPTTLYSQQPATQQPPPEPPKKTEHHSIGIGIKAGFNFANVTNASAINGSSRAGYHFGLFLAPHSKGVLGSRTELIYSKSGYNYATDTINGGVNLDYIMLTQMVAIHITKYFDIHLGGYTAYLLHVKNDTTQKLNIPNYPQVNALMDYFKRWDYGFGGGIEIHPVAGLIIGARYQLSFSNLYKIPDMSNTNNTPPPSSFSPSFNLKNNVVLISIGYRF